MSLFGFVTLRLVACGIGAGAIAGATLFGAVASAMADPPDTAPSPVSAAEPPPNCTAADLAGVAAGVAAGTSAYLFTHSDVNDFLTSLKGQPLSDIRGDLQNYMNANPQVHADLLGIRQPLTDLRNRCQLAGGGLLEQPD